MTDIDVVGALFEQAVKVSLGARDGIHTTQRNHHSSIAIFRLPGLPRPQDQIDIVPVRWRQHSVPPWLRWPRYCNILFEPGDRHAVVRVHRSRRAVREDPPLAKRIVWVR